jgi:hypothetical protein
MNNTSPFFLIPVAAGMVVIAVTSIVWHFSRSRSLVERWAAGNGYELLNAEYRNFFRGPFFWMTSKSQTVYHVEVRDQSGRIRSGWVRCGSWWSGLFSDQTEVRWEN